MLESKDLAAELIKEFEGFSPVVYCCPGGKRTIGYGHALAAGEPAAGDISRAEAEQLLAKDIERASIALQRNCFVPLSVEQEAALLSFIFNCGSGAFQASTLRQKLNRGEYSLAAAELPRWAYAGGVRLVGLVRRRCAEQALFLSGS